METVFEHYKESLLMLIWVVCGTAQIMYSWSRRNVPPNYLPVNYAEPIVMAALATIALFCYKCFLHMVGRIG